MLQRDRGCNPHPSPAKCPCIPPLRSPADLRLTAQICLRLRGPLPTRKNPTRFSRGGSLDWTRTATKPSVHHIPWPNRTATASSCWKPLRRLCQVPQARRVRVKASLRRCQVSLARQVPPVRKCFTIFRVYIKNKTYPTPVSMAPNDKDKNFC